MTSKQEKLAAARKKLKEFQVKNREADLSKQKNSSEILSFHPSKEIPSPCQTPLFSESIDSKNNNKTLCNITHSSGQDIKIEDKGLRPSELYSSNSNFQEENKNAVYENFESNINKTANKVEMITSEVFLNSSSQDYVKELKASDKADIFKGESFHSDKSDYEQYNSSYYRDSLKKRFNDNLKPMVEKTVNLDLGKEVMPSVFENPKEFFSAHCNTDNALNNIIKPLQNELENHAQTITILVQQRNDAQNSLSQTQKLLMERSDEIKALNQQVTYLTTSVNDLSQNLEEAKKTIKCLKIENDESVLKSNKMKLSIDELQGHFDAKEEELLEMRRKYEEKNKEHQEALVSLNDIQSQLSLCQIQLQQFSAGEHSSIDVSELQKENINLKQTIEDLKKKLEVDVKEKEQSSQHFHVYAQQCNSQISNLNAQLKACVLENDKLKQVNMILKKNLSDLEGSKEKDVSLENHKTEVLNLHKEITALTEENEMLKNDLKKKEEDLLLLKCRAEERDVELKILSDRLKTFEDENKRLISESEIPKADEKLLAAMESDKVAAAKAVSQNQKLKSQVIELEEAIMKMNQEKLELTEEISHEKHINKELQSRIANFEGHCHNHHHVGHSHDCKDINVMEPPVNDSNEIEELRNIISQLQEDKTELMMRLNSFTNNKKISSENYLGENTHVHSHKEDESECENTRLLLQQMEEKVKKTMNEIAILDEEKEKLEHLVLQLQGETETIGEYITLYQKQRMLLRQRAQEKDNQLIQLSKDKEELRSKLVALDELVQSLLLERKTFSNQSETRLRITPPSTPSVDIPDVTAEKIRALISDIGSTSLVNKHSVAFEHCSCCSGRLITI